MYRIIFTRQSSKELLKLPNSIAEKVRESLDEIAVDPFAQHPNVTKLTNRPGYRLRVGDRKVIYDIQKKELVILILKIGTRGEVYR